MLTQRIQVPPWTRIALLAASAGLCLGLAVCYALQPDACVALTIWPPWLWLLPGLLLTWMAWSRERKRPILAVTLLWLAFLLTFAEEPRSLARIDPGEPGRFAVARRSGRGLRVVSLNCAGGSMDAAVEVAVAEPDLVLLQEAPTASQVRKLGARLFGPKASTVCGLDTAILARGSLAPDALPRGTSHFIAARARLAGMEEVEVISLRLTPPVARFDLWSPGCWADYTNSRQVRREQLREVVEYLATLPPSSPVLLGGDFNAPAGDAIFRLLRPRLHDAFAEGGAGWGNTVLNDLPVSRIDQVWASRHFRALSLRARRTRNSDHRMVAGDLELDGD